MTESTPLTTPCTVVIGGGPAGLMAAEQLTQAGHAVALFDAMPSVGRKFLLAGIGGLNLTHTEPFADFISRYAESQNALMPALQAFDTEALRAWAQQLEINTFVGSSGRVFPEGMKAAPLLRAWLTRLKQQGLQLYSRHRWLGWDADQRLIFSTPHGTVTVAYHVVILALGGGSWSKLGSDGAWTSLLAQRGLAIAPLKSANCGFLCRWSKHLTTFAGSPLKSVSLRFTDLQGQTETRQGELIITEHGVEGSLIYAFSARLRETLLAQGRACFYLDLCPQHTEAALSSLLAKRPAKKSLGSFLKSRLHLEPIKVALLFEQLMAFHPTPTHPPLTAPAWPVATLVQYLKALPIQIDDTTALDEAISTAGGVRFADLDAQFMLIQQPGVFCAGEMLDWEAPTGGYLLNAVLATGRQAGLGAVQFLEKSAVLT